MKDKLDRIVREIDRLPPFPQVIMQAMDVLQDPDANADDVVKVIQYDTAVTANCLMLCNSSYFGLKERVVSLKHAVVLLGAANLVRIVVADNFRAAVFHRGRYDQRYQKPEALWWHCATTGIISQLLAAKVGYSDPNALFTAALLHDVGKLVIDRFVSADFENMSMLMAEEGFGKLEVEKAYFGIDHAAVGALIASAWRMPDPLTAAIADHHEPSVLFSESRLSALTAISNQLNHHFFPLKEASRQKHVASALTEDVLRHHGLAHRDLVEIGEQLPGEIQKAAAVLKFSDGGPATDDDPVRSESIQP